MSIPHLLRRTSAATVLALATVLPAQAETLVYATGFEAPGFSTGPIGGGYYDLPQWTTPTAGRPGRTNRTAQPPAPGRW
jgi:hypothetical protein